MALKIPERLLWAVDVLAIRPDDRILEIGCGRGIAVALIAAKLQRGTITAIDRSETAIAAARVKNQSGIAAAGGKNQTEIAAAGGKNQTEIPAGRVKNQTSVGGKNQTGIPAGRVKNQTAVGAGRVTLMRTALADAHFQQKFMKVLAVNVNVFWRNPERELAVLRKALAPRGKLYLVYEPPAGQVARIASNCRSNLEAGGFQIISVEQRTLDRNAGLCLIATGRFPTTKL